MIFIRENILRKQAIDSGFWVVTIAFTLNSL